MRCGIWLMVIPYEMIPFNTVTFLMHMVFWTIHRMRYSENETDRPDRSAISKNALTAAGIS